MKYPSDVPRTDEERRRFDEYVDTLRLISRDVSVQDVVGRSEDEFREFQFYGRIAMDQRGPEALGFYASKDASSASGAVPSGYVEELRRDIREGVVRI